MDEDNTQGNVFSDMRDFSYWRSRKEEIICRALQLGVPVELIAAQMGIAESSVRRVRQQWRKVSPS